MYHGLDLLAKVVHSGGRYVVHVLFQDLVPKHLVLLSDTNYLFLFLLKLLVLCGLCRASIQEGGIQVIDLLVLLLSSHHDVHSALYNDANLAWLATLIDDVPLRRVKLIRNPVRDEEHLVVRQVGWEEVQLRDELFDEFDMVAIAVIYFSLAGIDQGHVVLYFAFAVPEFHVLQIHEVWVGWSEQF